MCRASKRRCRRVCFSQVSSNIAGHGRLLKRWRVGSDSSHSFACDAGSVSLRHAQLTSWCMRHVQHANREVAMPSRGAKALPTIGARAGSRMVVDASVAVKWHLQDEEYVTSSMALLDQFAAGHVDLLA